MAGRRFGLIAGLILMAAASRVLPHPPNFTPIGAVALFGAATFDRKRWALLAPFAALLLSDALMEWVYRGGWQYLAWAHRAGWQPSWGFYRGQWVIYACFLATIGLGFLLRHRRNVATVAGATFASALLFFVVTNFAVWANGSGVYYAKTVAGLLACYTAAIPFFGNTLAGDFLYTGLLFGALALAESRFPMVRPRAVAPETATAV